MANSDQQNRALFLERLARLDGAVQEASGRPDRLTQGAIEFATALRELLGVLGSDFTGRWDALSGLDEGDRDEFRNQLLTDVQDAVADVTMYYLPILLGAQASRVPTEYELVVEDLLSSLCPDWHVIPILWGSDEYSYATRDWDHPVDWYSGNENDQSERPVFREFQLPSIERDSTLLHGVLVGHEIGHALDSFYEVSDGLNVPEARDVFNEAAPEHEAELLHSAYVFSAAAKDWAGEIIADIFSGLIFGPVALFSFREFSERTGPPTVDSLTHPGSDRRYEVICQVLERAGFGAMDAVAEWISDFRSMFPDALDRPIQAEAVDEEGCQMAWDWLKPSIPDHISRCFEVIEDNSLFSAERWPLVEKLSRRLLGGHVIGEVYVGGAFTFVPPPSILNAGWLVKANSLFEFGQLMNLDTSKREDVGHIALTLDGLIAKSLEISFHRRRNPWE